MFKIIIPKQYLAILDTVCKMIIIKNKGCRPIVTYGRQLQVH